MYYIVTKGDITDSVNGEGSQPVVVEATLVSCSTGPDIAASIATRVLSVKSNTRLHVWVVTQDSLMIAGVMTFRPQNVDLEPAKNRLGE